MKISKAAMGALLVALPLAAHCGEAGTGHAPTDGLAAKLIVGYQGWFGCPGDFENNRNWQHWFVKRVSPETLTVDLLPALHGIDEADLCDTGLKRADGSAVKLFSSQNPRIVATHFRWM